MAPHLNCEKVAQWNDPLSAAPADLAQLRMHDEQFELISKDGRF